MFDEFIREIKKLEQPVSVPIDLPLDDRGYLDRSCPTRDCRSEFKVQFDDWRDKVPEDYAVCPKCGCRKEPSEFNTEWQNKYIDEFATAYMSDRLNKALSKAARRTRPQRLASGLLNIDMSVSYNAGPVKLVLPPDAAEALRQDLSCEACQCRFSTIGAGYFCPACGSNSPLSDFERTLEMAQKSMDTLPALKKAFVDSHDEDAAADFEQGFLEDQVENLVTAFQRGTETLFARLPNEATFKRDANLFQRLEDASALWKSAAGTGYDEILDPTEYRFLNIMIHRRHKIGHCQSMVDAKYVQKSGDTSYEVGQRLVVEETQVRQLADVLQKLITALRKLVP